MARTSALLLTISLAATLAAKRTRYEIRDLNQSQWDQVVDVIWFMKNTTNHTLGVELYGPDFRSYDAFVIKHAVSSLDERGDQGHFGPPFMTFHRAYLLEIENSFLAILKVVFGAKAQIDAMPYWNPSPDSPASPGAYSTSPPGSHPKSIFSDNYLGAYDGDPTADMGVTNGRFAYWWIAKYNETYIEPEYYASSRAVFQGNPTTGLLRGAANIQWAKYNVRQKTVADTMFDGQQYLMWNDADFDKCTDASVVKEWMQWQACQNNAMVAGKPLGVNNSNVVSIFHVLGEDNMGPEVPHWMHTQAHMKIGSYLKPGSSAVLSCPGECPGDMTDVATSPNDIFFWFFHANLDRMHIKWVANLGWSASQSETTFDDINFPSSQREFFEEQKVKPYKDAPYQLIWTAAANGTTLDDIINSGYAFKKSLFISDPSGNSKLTHRDVLDAHYNDALPYTYAEPSFVQGAPDEPVTSHACFTPFQEWEKIVSVVICGVTILLAFYDAILVQRRFTYLFAIRAHFVPLLLIPGLYAAMNIFAIYSEEVVATNLILDLQSALRAWYLFHIVSHYLTVFDGSLEHTSRTMLEAVENVGLKLEALEIPRQKHSPSMCAAFWGSCYYTPDRSFLRSCIYRMYFVLASSAAILVLRVLLYGFQEQYGPDSVWSSSGQYLQMWSVGMTILSLSTKMPMASLMEPLILPSLKGRSAEKWRGYCFNIIFTLIGGLHEIVGVAVSSINAPHGCPWWANHQFIFISIELLILAIMGHRAWVPPFVWDFSAVSNDEDMDTFLAAVGVKSSYAKVLELESKKGAVNRLALSDQEIIDVMVNKSRTVSEARTNHEDNMAAPTPAEMDVEIVSMDHASGRSLSTSKVNEAI